MSSTLRRFDPWPLLRSAPIALPQVLALLVIVTLSTPEGGFPLEDWGPAAVLVSLLLIISLLALPARRPRPAGSTTAIFLLVGFALWTALSLLWADDRGAAALASTRTGFLAATFVLFARWHYRPQAALVVLTILTAGLGLFGWGVLVALHQATNLDPWFLYDRLLEPVGYVNAGAAFWGITSLLGVGLLGGAVATPQRMIGALVAVPAAALSLLCLSRGGVLAVAIVVVLILALLPGRARNATAFLITGLGLLVAAPALLDVGNLLAAGQSATATLHGAIERVVVGTLLVTLATVVWTMLDASMPVGDRRRELASRVGGWLLAGLAAVIVGCAIAGVGPLTVTTIKDRVHTITQPYSTMTASSSRLTAGLNSGRWDFWKVAWDQFERAPLLGAGADNYRQDYLLQGRTPENPRYPHSLWLRALGELGLVGTLLLLGWVGTVAVAIRRLAAGRDPAGRALALSAGGVFGLWVVHGSADWLLEYAGLTAIVAAVAGLAVAAGPDARVSRRRRPAWSASRTRLPAPRLAVPIGVALLAVLSIWTATQWVAERDRAVAAELAFNQPQRAVSRANRAATLDPFGDQAQSLLGALAIARGDYPAAWTAYADAYRTNPRATRPRLWLGVLASARGDQPLARRWLRRAHRAAPRDAIVTELITQLERGEQLDPKVVQTMLAERTAQLVRDPDPVAPTSPPPAAVNSSAAAG